MSTLTPHLPKEVQGSCTLLLFASASTYTSTDTLTLPAPTTLRAIFRHLESQYPGITAKVLRSAGVSVNLEYIDFDPEELEVDEGSGGGVGRQEREGVEGVEMGVGKGGEAAGAKEREGGEDGEDETGEGLDIVIHPGDEVGIIPPVSSG